MSEPYEDDDTSTELRAVLQALLYAERLTTEQSIAVFKALYDGQDSLPPDQKIVFDEVLRECTRVVCRRCGEVIPLEELWEAIVDGTWLCDPCSHVAYQAEQ